MDLLQNLLFSFLGRLFEAIDIVIIAINAKHSLIL